MNKLNIKNTKITEKHINKPVLLIEGQSKQICFIKGFKEDKIIVLDSYSNHLMVKNDNNIKLIEL